MRTMDRATRAIVARMAFSSRRGALARPGGGVEFEIWAPAVAKLSVRTLGARPALTAMERDGNGVHRATVVDARTDDDYLFVLPDGMEIPDPVSRHQARGVHGPSRIVDRSFAWTDAGWRGIPLDQYVLYELHVGTFSAEGTFVAVIDKLEYLRALGVTAIQLMPVVEFPGTRNWGYDGVSLFAPHSAYGGPDGLRALVDAAHRMGIAVVLDVVYNHLGPEGNYLGKCGPYFTDRYRTPWGDALNFDGPGSDEVRRFFIDNALYWLTEFHVDALRLDAIHGICDFGARHVLEEISDAFHAEAAALGRHGFLIAESDLNDRRVIAPVAEGGWNLDGQWSDDFHHAIFTMLTGKKSGYLADFGRMEDLAKSITDGFVYDGRYSEFRRRRHGNAATGLGGEKFVVFLENHDQIANGAKGQRLSTLVSLEKQKLAAAVLVFAPNVPMLFMGQEFADPAPFLYFTSHTDEALGVAVSEGRRREFADFHEAGDEWHDPQASETFARSKVTWGLHERGPHAELLALYRALLALRKARPALSNCRRDLTRVRASDEQGWVTVERRDPGGDHIALAANFSDRPCRVPLPDGARGWQPLLATAGGPPQIDDGAVLVARESAVLLTPG